MEIIDQPTGSGNQKSLESVLADGYTFKLGDYLGAGFKLFGQDAGSYIGFTLVYFVISLVVGMIPFIGSIAGLFLNPALLAGYFIYARVQTQGGERGFARFFDAFKNPPWMSLVVQNIITGLFAAIVVMAIILPFFFGTIMELLTNATSLQHMDQEEAASFMLGLFTGRLLVAVLLAVLVGSAIAVLYSLAPMFILFRGLGFWEAMEASRKVVMKQFVQFYLFFVLLMILAIVGVLLCCVGLLVALPVLYLALYAAFDDILGA